MGTGRLAGDVMTGRQAWDRILTDLHAGRSIPDTLPQRNGFVYGDQDELLNLPYYGYAGKEGGGSGTSGGGDYTPTQTQVGGDPTWVSGRPDVYLEGQLMDPSKSFNEQMADRSPRIREILNGLNQSRQRTEPRQTISNDAKELLDKMGVSY